MSQVETGRAASAERPAFKRRWRIVWSLLAMLAFVGLVPMATIAWKQIELNREALKTSHQEFQLLLATSIAAELELVVEAQRAQLERVARTLAAAIQRDGSVRQDEVREALVDVARGPMFFIRYNHSGSRGGKTITAGEVPDERNEELKELLLQAELATAAREVHADASALISDPFVMKREVPGPVLVASASVVSDGRLRGVLSALIDVGGIWERVAGQHLTGHVIWVLDETGNVFATTDPVARPTGTDAQASPIVKKFLSAEGRATETTPFVEGGVRFLGSYAATGQGWGVFVSAEERQAYLPVTMMIRGTVTWAAAALLLASFAAIVFARTLSTPINRLAQASRAFARGEFATRVEVRQRNEMGELAFTFNTMADEIEHRMRQLKRAAEENNELFLGTIRALAQAIDAKDPYTRGHSIRVNRYSVVLARELRLSDRDVRDIHVASLLHDVGKIGIDDAVLNKPGKLTPEEFELMKTHTVLGAQIMGQMPQMERIIPGLRWHHERWQGGGYPDGLSGEQIPLMARIIAVADTFDAVTTTRPYQKTMTVPEALEVLNRLKGVSLNETVVEAFFRAFQAGRIRLDPPNTPTAETPAPPPQVQMV